MVILSGESRNERQNYESARTSGEIEFASLTLPLSNKNRQLCKLDGKLTKTTAKLI